MRPVPVACELFQPPLRERRAKSQSSSLSVKTVFLTSGNSGVGHCVLFTLEFGRVCHRAPRSPSFPQVLAPGLLRCAFDVAGAISRLRQRRRLGPHRHSDTWPVSHRSGGALEKLSGYPCRLPWRHQLLSSSESKWFSQEHKLIPRATACHPNVRSGAFARGPLVPTLGRRCQ